ncbi:ABC transporter permease [Streptoalloteichus hindustanus]|uniref:Osmoprotectant transport system permease protein n=1 Tax=Streptoalloteichus hindustanus TaxID=2017 RepID=A0A1M5JWS1_STRHI|nr:ABC transporter permease subunit [Streptoalloteichus hindustanus]SHG45006.1 osmoprotectant transport system permease protein [Streptoalloteichus hindustanus]
MTLSWLFDPAHWSGTDGIPVRLLQHLRYTLVAALAATAVAVPLGLFVGHTGRGGVLVVGGSNAMRALPTLGLVTFLFLVLGSGEVSALVALTVLAVPPVLAGTYAGIQDTDAGVVDAARGMGMTGWQRLWRVELPNALPLLLGGVRNAVLQVVATTAVAAYVGLGGLGRFLLDGLRAFDYPKMVAGAVLVAALAMVLDLLLALLQRAVVPRGLRLAARGRGRGPARVVERGRTEVAADAAMREGTE